MATPAARSILRALLILAASRLSSDGKSAYALLNQNDTLTQIDLTATPPTQGTQIRVGNAPHSIVIASNGTTAYVSNEGGRAATERTSRSTPPALKSSPTRRWRRDHRYRFGG
jgi:DNA-binding beta-propeller fold protein YncE